MSFPSSVFRILKVSSGPRDSGRKVDRWHPWKLVMRKYTYQTEGSFHSRRGGSGADLRMDSPIPKGPCFLSCRTPWHSLTSWRDCGHSVVLTKEQFCSWTCLCAFFYLHLASMNSDLTLPIGHLPVIVASFYSQDPQWSHHTLSLFVCTPLCFFGAEHRALS